MLTAIVLAAGLSSRMGSDNKLLLPFNNKPAIRIVVESILTAGIKEVFVVTGHEANLVQNSIIDLAVHFVHNPRYAEGMTTSIQSGVAAAKGDGYMICLSDMVMITSSEYKFLIEAFEQRLLIDRECICLPGYKNKKGNPVIFSAAYKEAIIQNDYMEGCKNIIQANNEHLYLIDMELPHVLEDFDYPEDYKNLRPGL